jgi:hypothetical protein
MCAGTGDITKHLISAANTTMLSELVTNFTINLILTAESHCFSNKYRCFNLHCFVILVAVSLRPALFWDFSQCTVVITTEVSLHLTGPFFKVQAVQFDCSDCLNLGDGTREVSAMLVQINTLYCEEIHKRTDLTDITAEAWHQEDLLFLDYLTVGHGTHRMTRNASWNQKSGVLDSMRGKPETSHLQRFFMLSTRLKESNNKL